MPISDDDGRQAVLLARETLDAHVSGNAVPRPGRFGGVFSEARGVFVTINVASPGVERLRGCIGFPYPVMKLDEAIIEAAKAAATDDPRFSPVAPDELDGVVVEVSILTVPSPLRADRVQDLPSKVRIGTDGLMVSRSGQSGLLLPQVATDFGMGQAEFLSQACMKAGLLPDAWLQPGTDVEVFQAEIFSEPSPRERAERMTQAGA